MEDKLEKTGISNRDGNDYGNLILILEKLTIN